MGFLNIKFFEGYNERSSYKSLRGILYDCNFLLFSRGLGGGDLVVLFEGCGSLVDHTTLLTG